MLNFLSNKFKEQFDDIRLSKLLRVIVFAAAAYTNHKFDRPLYITSVFRDGDKGVHGYWRGVDADNDNILIANKIDIVDFINMTFIYDPERPKFKVCIHHTVKGHGGDHLHFQVHPRTTIRR